MQHHRHHHWDCCSCWWNHRRHWCCRRRCLKGFGFLLIVSCWIFQYYQNDSFSSFDYYYETHANAGVSANVNVSAAMTIHQQNWNISNAMVVKSPTEQSTSTSTAKKQSIAINNMTWRRMVLPRLAFLTALIQLALLQKQASAVDQHQQQQKHHEGGYLRRNFNRILSKATTTNHHHVDHNDEQGERELIVGGTDAETGRFPWFVALVNSDNETICGGTMIAPDVVLTAAHCSAAGVRSAMVGKHYYDRNDHSDNFEWIDLQSPYEMGATADFMQRNGHAIVDNVGFIHPYHSYRERTYDVMLLKLVRPTSTRIFVKVNFDADVPSRGTGNEITVIGMGRIDIDGPKPDVLQQVKLDFVPYDDCIDMTSYNVDYKYEVMPDMICSTGKGIYGSRGQCKCLL